VVEQVEQLRRQRYTGKQIAAELRISPATVSLTPRHHPSRVVRLFSDRAN
jgi:hypothetical protein